MSDCVQKAITANLVKNGSAVCYVSKLGGTQTIFPSTNENTDLTAIEIKYTNRFDDVNYYGDEYGKLN